MTFIATTNVPRARWKSRPYFKPNKSGAYTALIPAGGQIEIEYPQTGEVAMRFTITGGDREYPIYTHRRVKEVMLDFDTNQQLTTTYIIIYDGNEANVEFKPT